MVIISHDPDPCGVVVTSVVLVAKSCPTLIAHKAPLSVELLEWVAISFYRITSVEPP